MTRLTRAFLFIVLSLALSPPVQRPAPAQTRAARSPKTTAQKNSRVQTVPFQSKMMGKVLPYNVVLPADYNQARARAKRYPVLYLLHGLFGHYTDWTTRAKLADHSLAYGMIIVTPEGNNGWYTDSATAPTDKYETYILEELIPDVRRRFRTIETREGRAVAGLSMGGYGAIKFGLKHPEMFSLAASMSGAFGAASWTDKELKDPGVIRDSVMQAFGPANSPTRVANDVLKLAREVSSKRTTPLPYLYLDCGTEDFLFNDNREFAGLLVELKISHEYRQLPGRHDWPYWDRQVQEVLRLAATKMRVTQTVSLRRLSEVPPG